MNFDFGGPSNISSSSSSSESGDDVLMMDDFEAIDAEEAIYRAIANNNMILAQLLEQQTNHVRPGGSIPGHQVIQRDRVGADQKIFEDYFAENPNYNDAQFHRRFRMSRSLFLRIVDAVKSHDNYF